MLKEKDTKRVVKELKDAMHRVMVLNETVVVDRVEVALALARLAAKTAGENAPAEVRAQLIKAVLGDA